MKFSPETLMAYADGELDVADAPRDRSRDGGRSAGRAGSRAASRDARRGGRRISPACSTSRCRTDCCARQRNRQRSASAQPRRQWSWPEWTSIAASLLIGVLAGRAMLQQPDRESRLIVAGSDGRVIAGGALAQALSEQLSSQDGTGDRHRPDLPREVRRVLPHLRRARLEPGSRLRVPRCRGLAHRHAFDCASCADPAATIEWRAHSCRRPSSRPLRSGCRARHSMPTKKPSRASAAGGTKWKKNSNLVTASHAADSVSAGSPGHCSGCGPASACGTPRSRCPPAPTSVPRRRACRSRMSSSSTT